MTPAAALVAGACLVLATAAALRAAALALRAAFVPLTPRGQDELLGSVLAALAGGAALLAVVAGA